MNFLSLFPGVTLKERNDIVDSLNENFVHFLHAGQSIQEAYKTMVEKNNYSFVPSNKVWYAPTFLSSADLQQKGTRSPLNYFFSQEENDYNSNDPHFKAFPGHVHQLNKLQAAKKSALKNGARVYVTWRGYRGFVVPRKSPLVKDDFMSFLVSALKAIPIITEKEKKVSILKVTEVHWALSI